MPDQSNSPQTNHQAPIPEGLRDQLSQFKKQLWRIKIAEAILAGFLGLLLSFLLVFALDRFVETPANIRLAILIVGISLFALFAPYWIRRWVYGHRQEGQLARLITRRYPKLGDRLLGAVELQDQKEGNDSLSPALRAAAMRTVAAEVSGKDLLGALPVTRHKKLSLLVMGLFAIIFAALIITPEAGINSLKRWLLPLSDTDRYTFTELDLSDIGDPYYTAYGEAFTLTVPLDKETNRRPKTARAKYGKGKWIETQLEDDAYTFQFPAQRAAGKLYLEADDAHYSFQVEPLIRPSMEQIHASVQLPSYLERPDTIIDVRSGFSSILEGSEVTIQATTSRALSVATASATTLKEQVAAPENDPNSAEESSGPLPINIQINDRNITSAPIKMGPSPLSIPIEWTGIHGLKSDKPFKLRLENSQDQAPSTYLQGLERQHIMLAEETVSFEILAEDDYGLKSCGISWQGEFTKPTSGSPASGSLTLKKGSPTQTNINTPFALSPANLSIQPQKLIVRSWAEDYKPERGRIYSEPITLYILTTDEHAQVLKNQFDRIIGELEDIARKEQNLNDENQRLERKSGKELQTEAERKKLQKQQTAESENKERMEKLSENMEQLFKDAVRNGDIDKEVLKKMADAQQSMRELAEQDLPQVEQKLQDSQSQTNTEEKAKKDLQEAIEKQKQAIEKMKQALKDANEANKNFEAGTFVNRLKRAASEQDGVAASFIDVIDTVIGANFEILDPVEQRFIKQSAAQQRQTAADIRWIQEDLIHYYARTQKEEHKKLSNAMIESRIDEAMEQLSSRIDTNLSYTSIGQSKKWAKQLREWAKELKGSDGGAGGGGGGGGGQDQAEKDFEFMLKVMRMVQTEQDLRERARALENLKRSIQTDIPSSS